MSSGYTSTSFTTQSASYCDVDTQSLASSGPAIVTGSVSGSLVHVSTSGRLAAKRWSSVMYSRVMPVATSSVKGTGLLGSLTNSS